jgi:hypothetical protein
LINGLPTRKHLIKEKQEIGFLIEQLKNSESLKIDYLILAHSGYAGTKNSIGMGLQEIGHCTTL